MGKSAGHFGIWLRSELDQRGYTERGALTRFARESGVHLSILSRTLKEGRAPEIDALRKIGLALGIPLGEMLIAAGIATPDELRLRQQEPPPVVTTAGEEEPDYQSMSTEELIREIPDPSPVEQAMLKMLASLDTKLAQLGSKVDRLSSEDPGEGTESDDSTTAHNHRDTA